MGKENSNSKKEIKQKYCFKLFVAGKDPNSQKASEVLKSFCQTYITDQYKLEIIDVYENYQTAIENKITAVPTLIVQSSNINTTIIGSLDSPESLAKTLSLI